MSVMWGPLPSQNFKDGPCSSLDTPQNEQPWFKSIFNTVLRYKNGLFGGHASPPDPKQRALDCTVPVNYKFIFALCCDGFFRPGAIVGKNRKQQEFVIYFYHNKKCAYVKRKNMVLKHGNLLDKKVFFCHCGQKKKAKVFGNNSPANNGFPSVFYLKKKDVWYKIPFKSVFLSKKMVRKCNLEGPKKNGESSLSKIRPDVAEMMT